MLAKIAIDIGRQLAGLLAIECIEVEIHLGSNLRIGRFQVDIGQHHLLVVEPHLSTQLFQVHPAFLTESALAERHLQVGRTIGKRVDANSDVRQGEVVGVEATDRLGIIVVVGKRP